MDDAGGGRHDAETLHALLSPAQELVSLPVALEFNLRVACQRLRRGEEVDLNRVIDDQVDGDAGIDAGRVSPETGQGGSHGCKIDDGRDTREILHDDAGGQEGHFWARICLWFPGGQCRHMPFGDGQPVDLPKNGLE